MSISHLQNLDEQELVCEGLIISSLPVDPLSPKPEKIDPKTSGPSSIVYTINYPWNVNAWVRLRTNPYFSEKLKNVNPDDQ